MRYSLDFKNAEKQICLMEPIKKAISNKVTFGDELLAHKKMLPMLSAERIRP